MLLDDLDGARLPVSVTCRGSGGEWAAKGLHPGREREIYIWKLKRLWNALLGRAARLRIRGIHVQIRASKLIYSGSRYGNFSKSFTPSLVSKHTLKLHSHHLLFSHLQLIQLSIASTFKLVPTGRWALFLHTMDGFIYLYLFSQRGYAILFSLTTRKILLFWEKCLTLPYYDHLTAINYKKKS